MSSRVLRAGRPAGRWRRWPGAQVAAPTPADGRGGGAAGARRPTLPRNWRQLRTGSGSRRCGRRARPECARGRPPAGAGRGRSAAGDRAAGARHRGTGRLCAPRLRREAEADTGATGAGHRAPRAAPRTGGRSRGAARAGAGGAGETAGAGDLPRAGAPLAAAAVRGLPAAGRGRQRAWRWWRTRRREPGAVVFETERGNLDASVESQLQEIERGLADRLRRQS